MPSKKPGPNKKPAPGRKTANARGAKSDARPAKTGTAKRSDGDKKASANVRVNRPVKTGTYKKSQVSRGDSPAGKKNVQSAENTASKGERIAKVIARAGLCSRRDAERWIAEGRVKLDGKTLDTAAVVVTRDQSIVVDGQALPAPEQARVWRFHKPKGVITTRKDPEGRTTVFDDLPADLPRLEPVGRLDYNSEGLLLFTNDGELKRKLELPSTGWSRRYRVRVHGKVDPAQIKALENGITVEGVNYGPIQARLEHQAASNAWIAMTLREGKNREIRRICEHLGLVVNRLIRVSYGPFALGELAPGKIESIPARILRDQLGMKNTDVEAASQGAPKKATNAKSGRAKTPAGARSTAKTGARQTAGSSPSRPSKGATDLTDISGKKTKGGKRKGGSTSRGPSGKPTSAKKNAPNARATSATTGKSAPGTSRTPAASAKRGGKNANRRRTS